MSVIKPIAFTQFKFENLVIPPLASKSGGLMAHPTYQYSKGITGDLKIQLQVGRTPFGFSSFPDKKDPTKFTDSMSIDIQKGSAFENFCKETETNIQNYTIKNAASCYPGKTYSEETLRAFSNGVIKVPQDLEKAKANLPTFNAKIREKYEVPPKDGKAAVSFNPRQFWTSCIDSLKNAIPITSVGKNSQVRLVIQLSNYYVISGKYGFSWDLIKCEVIQSGDNSNVETDPGLYPEEACYIQAPAKSIDEAYDDQMEAAIHEAETSKKREREEEEEEEESTSKKTKPAPTPPQEEERNKKNPKKTTKKH